MTARRRVQRHRDQQFELARMPAAMPSGSHAGSGDTSRPGSLEACARHAGRRARFLQNLQKTAVHRAIECGAVLGDVNALRDHGCASTARSARPAGVDVACAQLGSGSCALAGAATPIVRHQSSIDSTRDEAYFEVITFVPHGTPSRRPA